MHHAEIGYLVETIQDYFLVSNFKPICEVVASLDRETGYRPSNGIKIICRLENGCIEAEINNPDEDSNTIILSYYSNMKNEEKFHEEFTGVGSFRHYIREILIIDMSSNKQE
jgi:hypothetical protein